MIVTVYFKDGTILQQSVNWPRSVWREEDMLHIQVPSTDEERDCVALLNSGEVYLQALMGPANRNRHKWVAIGRVYSYPIESVHHTTFDEVAERRRLWRSSLRSDAGLELIPPTVPPIRRRGFFSRLVS